MSYEACLKHVNLLLLNDDTATIHVLTSAQRVVCPSEGFQAAHPSCSGNSKDRVASHRAESSRWLAFVPLVIIDVIVCLNISLSGYKTTLQLM